MRRTATAFAPATVSNVACGFDVLGFAMDAPGDTVTATWSDAPGITIDAIEGDGGRLPREAARNTAGIAAAAMRAHLGESRGIALVIRKGLPLSSGLGGSAASAAAAVVAVAGLAGATPSADVLIACALDGERDGAGSSHADNIAPCICGGFVLVRQASPADIVTLPVPAGLTAVVVHPDLEIETAMARQLLGTEVPLTDAVQQWANLGAFVHALHTADFSLLSRSLQDTIAEPRRAPLLPGLAQIQEAARAAGALGCSLSGSGPSLFALCAGDAVAARVAEAMGHAIQTHTGVTYQTYISRITGQGARLLD